MNLGPVAKGILAVIFIATAGGGVWYMQYMQRSESAIPEGVACTMDAMQCPDGSYVGRTGPHCEFICPAVSSTTGSTSGTGSSGGGSFAEYTSGIKGTVLAGPTCPVERNPPDPACADRPIATNIVIYRSSDSVHPLLVTRSDEQGKFEASLPPGRYIVRGGEAVLPRCTDTSATVGPTGYTTVAVSCDTGIR